MNQTEFPSCCDGSRVVMVRVRGCPTPFDLKMLQCPEVAGRCSLIDKFRLAE